MNILENGDVLPCCVAGGDLIMGNLKRNPFEEIWNGPAYQRLRRTVNSAHPHPVCKACNMRGGAQEETHEILLNGRNLMARMKGSVKQYLLRSGRKKTLAKLTGIRDAINRTLARI